MTATLYSARFNGPTLIERDKAQTITVDLERGGSDPTISSATFTLYDSGGSKVIDGTVATISGGEISGSIGETDLDGKSYGLGWLVQFDATIGGKVYRFLNDAALCLARLYPPVGHTDLVNRHSDVANLLATGVTSLQQYIDDAWADITNRLYSDSIPFFRLRTPSAFRAAMFSRSFTLIFRDYSTLLDPGDRYAELADRYDAQFEEDIGKIRSKMDTGEDNTLTTSNLSTATVIQLTSSRRTG
tara:strand:- start:9875 stop:10606 length:732 start_codon:yes stop_codon:yes gene_type:complete